MPLWVSSNLGIRFLWLSLIGWNCFRLTIVRSHVRYRIGQLGIPRACIPKCHSPLFADWKPPLSRLVCKVVVFLLNRMILFSLADLASEIIREWTIVSWTSAAPSLRESGVQSIESSPEQFFISLHKLSYTLKFIGPVKFRQNRRGIVPFDRRACYDLCNMILWDFVRQGCLAL